MQLLFRLRPHLTITNAACTHGVIAYATGCAVCDADKVAASRTQAGHSDQKCHAAGSRRINVSSNAAKYARFAEGSCGSRAWSMTSLRTPLASISIQNGTT